MNSPQLARARGARLLRKYAPAGVVLILAVALWEVAFRTLGVQSFVFSRPLEIAEQFGVSRTVLLENAWISMQEIFFGFLIAVAAGVSFAVLLHVSTLARQAIYPLLVMSQTIPLIVLAPILVIALGFGVAPKLLIVAIICFFPIAVNGLDGLRAVDPDYIRVVRTLHGSRLDIFRRVEFHAALPRMFSGLRIAAVYAPIGAVLGEWSGAEGGLGYLIQQDTAVLNTARIFAAITVLSLVALLLAGVVAVVERLTVPWAHDRGATS